MASTGGRKELAAVHVDIELHWGYSIAKPIYTAYQPTFKIIPPTTLLGALSYPYAVLSKRPEVVNLCSTTIEMSNYVSWVTERLDVDPRVIIESVELTKYITSLGVRAENLYIGSPYIWAVQPRGRLYLPGQVVHVVYITAKPDSVKKYAWGIWRLGTRETPVAVVNVVDMRIVSKKDNVGCTRYMFPANLAKKITKGDYAKIDLPSIEKAQQWYMLGVKVPGVCLEPYIVPVSGTVEVEVTKDAVVLVDESGEEYVVPSTIMRLDNV